jgi:hypothetical protein
MHQAWCTESGTAELITCEPVVMFFEKFAESPSAKLKSGTEVVINSIPGSLDIPSCEFDIKP